MDYDYDYEQQNLDYEEERCCACCGEPSGDGEYVEFGGEYLCQECLEEKSNHRYADYTEKCEKCGCELDEAYTDECGEVVCPECFYKNRLIIFGY